MIRSLWQRWRRWLAGGVVLSITWKLVAVSVLWWFGWFGPSAQGDLRLVDPGEPVIAVWLDGKVASGGGTLVVQSSTPRDATVDLPEPEVKDLRFDEQGEGRVEQLGDRQVVTRRYHFSGDANAYEVPALKATWSAGDASGELRSDPLWIDLGVEPPKVGELADIRDPRAVRAMPSVMWGVALGGAVALLGAFVVWWRRERTVAPPPPPPPADVRALTAWENARSDASLSPMDLAVALSLIFREYAEEVLAFPAARWTTTESLQHLESLKHLPQGNVPRAKRLLRATDRVKYAEAAVDAEVFDELDADLRAFVDATRPARWESS